MSKSATKTNLLQAQFHCGAGQKRKFRRNELVARQNRAFQSDFGRFPPSSPVIFYSSEVSQPPYSAPADSLVSGTRWQDIAAMLLRWLKK